MISVIIPTYKRAKYICQAVSSVHKQTYQEIEIIVVDDNGLGTQAQKDTQIALREWIEKKNVVYIAHETNKGGCAARNTGMRAASGEFVALLDDDDIWLPTFLEKLLPLMKNPKVGAVYARNYMQIGENVYVVKHASSCKRGNVHQALVSGWCVASTSFFLLRRSCVERVNGFDETLASFQDYDMWVRMSEICEFDYCEERLVIKMDAHDMQQVSFNPVRRQAGLDALHKKMKERLSEEEYQLFLPFVKTWEKEILINRLLMARSNRLCCADKKALWTQYYQFEKSKKRRLVLYAKILIGNTIRLKSRGLVLSFSGVIQKVALKNHQ